MKSKGEKLLPSFFSGKYGINLLPIKTSIHHTPDYYGLKGVIRYFVAELKDVQPSSGIKYTDRRASKLGDDIYKAHKQFKYRKLPRVLIIVNFDMGTDVNDLILALKGELDFWEEGKPETIHVVTLARDVAFGKIAKIKERIDLYIFIDWIDGSVSRLTKEGFVSIDRYKKTYFLPANDRGQKLYRELFATP